MQLSHITRCVCFAGKNGVSIVARSKNQVSRGAAESAEKTGSFLGGGLIFEGRKAVCAKK
jgi:hypothetical protein